MKYSSELWWIALAATAVACDPADPSDPSDPAQEQAIAEDALIPIPGLQSCPSSSGYAASPPSLFAIIDPIPLLNGAPSVCAAAGPNSPCAPHRIYKPNANAPTRSPLLVFLPGTNMEPDKHDLVLATGAYAGYRTIGLAYDNRVAVSVTCAGAAGACMNNCTGLARTEAILGNNVSAVVISRGDSVLERLYRVLEELDAIDPMGGWSAYYVPTMGNISAANIVWSDVIVAGFSQGAGHAAYISHTLPVHGLVVFDGANDTCTDPMGVELVAEWTTATPDASSGRPKYVVAHDHNIVPFTHALEWAQLGLGTTAHPFDSPNFDWIDTVPPGKISWTSQGFPAAAICSEHMSIARDQCLPTNVTGNVAAATAPNMRLFSPYLRRFCYACDIGTCP